MKKLLIIIAVLGMFPVHNAVAQNPTDFDFDTTMLPGKKMIITVTLNQLEFIGCTNVHAFPVHYWCMGQASPMEWLGSFMADPDDSIPSVGISKTDTIDFSLYDDCANPNIFGFKYSVIGSPQGDTAGTEPLFWIEKVLDIYLNPTLGIDDPGVAEAINVYPNPAMDMVTIEGFPMESTATLYNSAGQAIKSEVIQSDRFMWETLALPSGLYIIKFDNPAFKGVVVKKFLVQH